MGCAFCACAATLHAAGVHADVRAAAASADVHLLGDGVRALGRGRTHRPPPRRQRRARLQQPQGTIFSSKIIYVLKSVEKGFLCGLFISLDLLSKPNFCNFCLITKGMARTRHKIGLIWFFMAGFQDLGGDRGELRGVLDAAADVRVVVLPGAGGAGAGVALHLRRRLLRVPLPRERQQLPQPAPLLLHEQKLQGICNNP